MCVMCIYTYIYICIYMYTYKTCVYVYVYDEGGLAVAEGEVSFHEQFLDHPEP